MTAAKLTISIDLELAWGVWDHLTAEHLRLAESAERAICAALIDLFDRHQIPATWAVVAALLDEASATTRPGAKACWFAPDIVERLLRNKAGHEIGTHSGRHIYFDSASAEEARADLDFRQVGPSRTRAGSRLVGVSARARPVTLDAVAGAGLEAFSCDQCRLGRVRPASPGGMPGRSQTCSTTCLPMRGRSRQTPSDGANWIHIPRSMLLMGRNGPRRLVLLRRSRVRQARAPDYGVRRRQAKYFTSGSIHRTSTIARPTRNARLVPRATRPTRRPRKRRLRYLHHGLLCARAWRGAAPDRVA